MKSARGVFAAIILGIGIIARPNSGYALLTDPPDPSIDVSGLSLVAPEDVPEFGTFYTATLGYSQPPLPVNPFPENSVYSLGDDTFVVDDFGGFMMMGLTPPEDGEGEGEGDTNSPCVLTWPVSLGDLTLIDSNNVPESATFFFYTDQTNGDTPPPYPYNPLPQCPVYSLGCEGFYLVDDTGVDHPEGSMELASFTSQSFAQNDLWLEITNVSGGYANLILHGTEEGAIYQIQSQQTLFSAWASELVVTGAISQTVTPFSVPVGSRTSSLFFRAHEGVDPLGPMWVEIAGISNGLISIKIHNTSSSYVYEVQSCQSMTDSSWGSEGTVQGVDSITSAVVPILGKTNLFIRARNYSLDTEGGGLPDWWQLKYFGQIGIDPYGDADNDGWNNLMELHRITNPNQFDTPPPPRFGQVWLGYTGTNITFSWAAGGGPVQSYVIEEENGSTNSIVGSGIYTTTATISAPALGNFYHPYGGVYGTPSYRIRATFANGMSSTSGYISARRSDLLSDIKLVRGSNGHFNLVAADLPQNLAGVRLAFWFLGSGFNFSNTWFDVAADQFTNGIAEIPDQPLLDNRFWVDTYCQISTVDNEISAMGGAGPWCDDTYRPPGERPQYYIHNNLINVPSQFASVIAAPHLKENLKFFLRAATITQPFGYSSDAGITAYDSNSLRDDPGYAYVHPQSTNGYEYSGYRTYSPELDYLSMDERRPLREHHLLRNFTYSTADYNSASSSPSNGAGYGSVPYRGLRTLSFPKYFYTNSGTEATLPLAFDSTNTDGLFYGGHPFFNSKVNTVEMGANTNSNFRLVLSNGMKNIYGLDILSLRSLHSSASPHNNILYPGTVINTVSFNTGGNYFPQMAVPELQIVDYYFASQTPAFDYDGSLPPVPGSPDFTVTNTSPVMVASVGNLFIVAGWAKEAILNGASNKFGYLEQYFDKACKLDTNGVATTNQAGIVSPYGEFFPTEPGPIALLTMPDIDTGQRGTAIVQVVKIQFDVNHDGVMDLTYSGPDNSAYGRRAQFWVNNNFDRWDYDLEDGTNYQDDVFTAGSPGHEDITVPDYAYATHVAFEDYLPAIPCEKDLEDYARMWMPGLTSVMATMPTNYTVKLTLTGSGQIRIFRAVEPSGGFGYLTNQITASNQVAQASSLYLGLLTSSSPIILSGQTNLGEYFIFCGVNRGSADIHLQILDEDQHLIARATAYLQLDDIKEMYERWTVGERPTYGPTNVAQLACEPQDLPSGVTMPFQYSPTTGTNTPYILYVHGWNMMTWQKDRFAETAFKRLYWQGYQGRFGIFRWPTDYGFKGTLWKALTDPHNYDYSELNAWKSAAGLLNKLNDLDAEYPGHVYMLAHSMGNVVAGEALRLAGTNRIVNTYIASQGAVPAHAYDSTVTNLIDFTHKNPSFPLNPANFGPTTPNIYGDLLAGNSAAVGRRVNFYNGNDYALSPDAWCFNQELKPDTFIGGYYYYTGATNDSAPWNNFTFIFTIGDPPPSPVVLDIVTSLQDRYSAMAYAAESRSRAMGSTPAIANLNSLDLASVWPSDPTGNNYSAHLWHSAEFRGTAWQQWNYWNILLHSETVGFDINNP